MKEFFELKALDLIQEPSRWSAAQQFRDPATNSFRDRELVDHHKILATYPLVDWVPELIRDRYDTALNLALYSWFVPAFNRVGEMHALATVELALRVRLHGWFPKRRDPLASMLEQAVELGLLSGKPSRAVPVVTAHGRAWEPMRPSEPGQYDAYIEELRKAIPNFRNRLAHGDTGFVATAYETLAVCGDLIEEIWNPTNPLAAELKQGWVGPLDER